MNVYEVTLTIKVQGLRIVDDQPQSAVEKASRMIANDLNRQHEIVELEVVNVEGDSYGCKS
jgi:hypothetical protein